MLPLDLTSAAPRSAWEQLDGLYLMPRTIDKLRAQLPGGKTGTYLTHQGFSKALMRIIHVEEGPLREAVAKADSEDVTDELREVFDDFYSDRPPELRNLFDILDRDDNRHFPQRARRL
ncbi:MAG: DUF5069 domain-containing protein [Candidatus Baltobacteraceae bacterium]